MKNNITTGRTGSCTFRTGDYQMPSMQGWQCPICGRVMSPSTPCCPCNGRGWETITTTGTGSGDYFPDYARTYSAKDADGNYITNLCGVDITGTEIDEEQDTKTRSQLRRETEQC